MSQPVKNGGCAKINLIIKFQKSEEGNEKLDHFITSILTVALNDQVDSHSSQPDIPPEPGHDQHDNSKNEDMDVVEFSLMDLFPEEIEPFYRYEGSLTTPNCAESVTWTVLNNQLPVNEQHVSSQFQRRN